MSRDPNPDPTDIEGRLRELAPQALGVVARRYGDFAGAEDAVQEALLAAATQWPVEGEPDDPRAWLVRVASRRMVDEYRRADARRRREDLAASWSTTEPDLAPAADDTLILVFMCCHPALSPATAIPLTFARSAGSRPARSRAPSSSVRRRWRNGSVGPRRRSSASNEPFSLPPAEHRADRLRSVLHVLYLLFNEGYATSAGPELVRADLSSEAIRLTRAVLAALPDDGEVLGLLALMLLTEARRPARTGPSGELVPLAEQRRELWNRDLVAEGVALVTEALRLGNIGEYQIQAAIAAVHDQAPRYADTEWAEILALYGLLERMTGNPMVTLNRAVAAAMANSPAAGLAILDGLDERLGDHHRLHSVRAHLLELAGDDDRAIVEFTAAAARTTNLREQQYLTTQAARLSRTSTSPE